MKIEIFDVDLGQCAMIHCPNGKKLMIDAGHKSGSWRPSTHFKGYPIELLVLSNFDEDHASDFGNLQSSCSLNAILRNASVDSRRLALMKADGGMGLGIERVYQWLKWVENQQAGRVAIVDLGTVSYTPFCNNWPTFTKPNDLSLVTFVSYAGFTILFPGDLERPGWLELLKKSDFRAYLSKTDVLLASHHGRENGCCDEVFGFMKPQAVIISDAGKQHATQETVGWYRSRATGCRTRAGEERKVLTTRNDGKITIEVMPTGNWTIGTSKNHEHPSIGLSALASTGSIGNLLLQSRPSAPGLQNSLLAQRYGSPGLTALSQLIQNPSVTEKPTALNSLAAIVRDDSDTRRP